MTVAANVIDAIGNTPLIELRAASKATGCRILGKAEFMNPGGSVKDRAALLIVTDAIASGVLQARRHYCRRHGRQYRHWSGAGRQCAAAIARSSSFPTRRARKKRTRCGCKGAELVEVPAVPYADPNNYVKLSGRLAERLAEQHPQGAIWANQFDNTANRDAHIATTGARDFRRRLKGEIDGFICACGTGGTLAGVGMALKQRNPQDQDRPRRPDGRCALFLLYERRT